MRGLPSEERLGPRAARYKEFRAFMRRLDVGSTGTPSRGRRRSVRERLAPNIACQFVLAETVGNA